MLKSVRLLKWFMINMNRILSYYDVLIACDSSLCVFNFMTMNSTGFMVTMFVFLLYYFFSFYYYSVTAYCGE